MHHRVALPDGVDILRLLIRLILIIEVVVEVSTLIGLLALAHIQSDIVLRRIVFANLNIKVLSLDLISLVLVLLSGAPMKLLGRNRRRRNNQETILGVLLIAPSMLSIIKMLLVWTLVARICLVPVLVISVPWSVVPLVPHRIPLLLHIPLNSLRLLLVVGTLFHCMVRRRLKALIKALLERA